MCHLLVTRRKVATSMYDSIFASLARACDLQDFGARIFKEDLVLLYLVSSKWISKTLPFKSFNTGNTKHY